MKLLSSFRIAETKSFKNTLNLPDKIELYNKIKAQKRSLQIHKNKTYIRNWGFCMPASLFEK